MIGFYGMSHLGIVSSIAAAAKGSRVLACDNDSHLVSSLAIGTFPIFEEGLSKLFAESKERISFTTDSNTLKDCGLIYVSLDVPTDEQNLSQRDAIVEACTRVLNAASTGATIVVLSQVNPGFTSSFASQHQALIREKKLSLYYQVETLIFGCAVDRAMNPERIILGCQDPETPLPREYEKLLKSFDCPLLPMRYESAELAKISINLFLVSSISTTNTLADICERIGADWSEIKEALRLDKRIGKHAYLSPGLGIAGGNLERDLASIVELSAETGADASLISSWMEHLHYRQNWLQRTLHRELGAISSKKTIALWGLAYKAGTKSIKNSPSARLLSDFRAANWRAFDPQVKLDSAAETLTQCDSPLSACRNAEVLVVATPWPEFAEVSPEEVASQMPGRVLLDPYAVLDRRKYQKLGFSYFTLGVK